MNDDFDFIRGIINVLAFTAGVLVILGFVRFVVG